jgi:hypothetical protein
VKEKELQRRGIEKDARGGDHFDVRNIIEGERLSGETLP